MLHLVPGALALGVYIAVVPIVGQLGMPTIAALAVSGLLEVVPLQLALPSRHRVLLSRQPAAPGCRQDGAAGDRWLTPRSLPDITCGHHG
jgi:hypothetical protein